MGREMAERRVFLGQNIFCNLGLENFLYLVAPLSKNGKLNWKSIIGETDCAKLNVTNPCDIYILHLVCI